MNIVYKIKKTDCTGDLLGKIEADDPGIAAQIWAKQRGYHGVTRVTGDPGKSGCFRGVDYRAGVEHCGDLFHVGMA